MQVSRSAGFTVVDRADKYFARSDDKAISSPISEKPATRMPSVSISGEALLRQRLFHITDPNRAVPVLGKADCGALHSRVEFLTRDDRQLLGDVYEWAQEQGADLKYVDDLGLRLASYREADNGRMMVRENTGRSYDGEGHKLYLSFTDKDAASAKRILEGDALKTTRLDHGFVRFITDKDYGSINHNDFDFMEQVINRFSNGKDESQPLTPRFAKYEYLKNNFVRTLSKEKYVDGKESVQEDQGTQSTAKKTTKPKPVTVESLRDDRRAALFKMMNVTSFKSLFALLFGNRR
ncbi:hypothetical protein V2K54_11950 [Pseudomonas alliivorans]|uniref:hypothetical protein n=1 Tax=Pseudomonas alliivorans TaxID=2810613 RepID=UPI001F1D1835|nr:hypothetical protein [Pseudomonas alliivorans]MEE4746230.1 hypothetical protein [Pseudomonas alliivorans]MEE4881841.1 hypothetical protein [Pseudomonas alliivorans]MEE4933233.1 hypothetical protein [Pseudomonas alliivorans]MEE4938479.1 hypothetical protein [Pseudomonas alliivorans]MEE4943653.1 hypothetical protein [Pseudomonas alliivorans]